MYLQLKSEERTYSRKRETPANDTYRRKRKKANVCPGIEYQRSEGICLRCRMERHGGFCLDEGKMIARDEQVYQIYLPPLIKYENFARSIYSYRIGDVLSLYVYRINQQVNSIYRFLLLILIVITFTTAQWICYFYNRSSV